MSSLVPMPRMLLHPELCEAVADFVIKHPTRLPKHHVLAGNYLRHTVARKKEPLPKEVGNIVTSWPGGDKNRLDGKTPRGDTRPAIYTSLDDHAVMAECLHYSKHRLNVPVFQYKQLEERMSLWLPLQTVFTLQVQRPLVVADLRRDDPNGMGFLKDMNADPAVKAALRKAGHAHLLLGLYHDHDYSTARGFGYAADRHLGLAGVALNTARLSQHADRFADNLALYGEFAKPLAVLKVMAAQELHADPARGGQPVLTLTYLDPSLTPEKLGLFSGDPGTR